jgi:PEP-CTERM motif
MTWTRTLALIFTLATMTSPAWGSYGTDVSYTYLQTGNHYIFNVNLHNDSTAPDTASLDYFRIILNADPTFENYSNVAWNDGKGWLTWVDQPLAGFGGAPGVLHGDDSILGNGGGGIPHGATVNGFQFAFDYSGSVLPAQQLLAWHAEYGTNLAGLGIPQGDPQNPDYWIMGSADGNLHYAGGEASVPEPGTILLVGAGLVGLVYRKKRQ